VPEDADTPRFRTTIGSVYYVPEKSAIVWKIKQFGGGKEFLMRAELGLPSVKGSISSILYSSNFKTVDLDKRKRPVELKFEIPYFTTSGIQVRYLKIVEPKLQYPALPWVRYITQAGDYALRLGGDQAHVIAPVS
jgi:AP-1 complex subunit mu